MSLKKQLVGVLAALSIAVTGGAVAERLAAHGFRVRGWSRRPLSLPGVQTSQGLDGLMDMLPHCEILVCLLPLTDDTRGLLNAEVFRCLPEGACLINCGRGGHIDEPDLLQALTSGRLRGAMLDVMAEEPPEQDSPLWRHPGVRLTPRVAAQTRDQHSIAQIAENIRCHRAGLSLLNVVDRTSGY